MLGLRCVHLNVRSVLFILISCILNGIRFSHTALYDGDGPLKVDKTATNNQRNNHVIDGISFCAMDVDCNQLDFPCIDCEYNSSCVYGKTYNATCWPKSGIQCKDQTPFQREWTCRYCYQTETWEHACVQKGFCNSMNAYYRTNCTVHNDVLCMGRRTFAKNVNCNWTKGYKWSTALILSITLGGFGVDRFYLGHWQEGIGKLFSFGGLGIWTLIDVILISLHYLGPADGSLYL